MSALAPNPPDGVEVRPAIAVDIDAIARRPLPAMVEAPPDDREVDFMPALVSRPRVIPCAPALPSPLYRPRRRHAARAVTATASA